MDQISSEFWMGIISVLTFFFSLIMFYFAMLLREARGTIERANHVIDEANDIVIMAKETISEAKGALQEFITPTKKVGSYLNLAVNFVEKFLPSKKEDQAE